jgi:hypothetical protein
MPVIDGEEVLKITAAQLDDLFFNINFGSVDYKALQPTPYSLFNKKQIAAAGAERNQVGVYTGNNAKMSVTFTVEGGSTDCTMNLYGSDSADLSNPGIISTLTLATGMDSARFAIEPSTIPAYTFCECVNNDTLNPAVCTVGIVVWK